MNSHKFFTCIKLSLYSTFCEAGIYIVHKIDSIFIIILFVQSIYLQYLVFAWQFPNPISSIIDTVAYLTAVPASDQWVISIQWFNMK